MFNPILCDRRTIALALHQATAHFDDDDDNETAAMSICQRGKHCRTVAEHVLAAYRLFAFSMTLNSFLLWITKCQTCVVICIHDKILHIYGKARLKRFSHTTPTIPLRETSLCSLFQARFSR